MATTSDVTICCTATLRHDIVARTFESFYRNMFFAAPPLVVVNIDPVGNQNETPDDILNTVHLYFDRIVPLMPKTPSFPKAFINVLSKAKTKYTFFLEDDWELVRYVDLAEMVNIMDSSSSLALLRLPRWEATETTARQWNKHLPWNGSFFEVPNNLKQTLGFSGNPSLIRTDFIRAFLSLLDTDRCPEKQLKTPLFSELHQVHRFGVFQQPEEKEAVKDIGSAWRKERRLMKDSRWNFHTWKPY